MTHHCDRCETTTAHKHPSHSTKQCLVCHWTTDHLYGQSAEAAASPTLVEAEYVSMVEDLSTEELRGLVIALKADNTCLNLSLDNLRGLI